MNNSLKIKILAVVLIMPTFLSQKVHGAEMLFRGFIDTYHAFQIKKPNDYISSRTRARIEAQFSHGNAAAFASCNAVYNHVVQDETGINLLEAYAEYAADWWDLRVGRQIIIWGQADGLTVTDIISPKDYSEFLARDFDDMRLPVEAVKAHFLSEYVTVEGIWVVIFKESVLPSAGNPWATGHESGLNVDVNRIESPELRIGNSEAAAKISLFPPGFDLSFSFFYTWDDVPVMHNKTINGGDLDVDLKYHRLMFAGLDFSVPLGECVLRGEGAYFHDKYIETVAEETDPLKRDLVKALVGLDWSPGDNWTISVQFLEAYILQYRKRMSEDEHSMTATLQVSKKLLRETLELSAMIYFGINDLDMFCRTYIDYALTDELHASIGVDGFTGKDRKGQYSQYEDNSEIWAKIKYSF